VTTADPGAASPHIVSNPASLSALAIHASVEAEISTASLFASPHAGGKEGGKERQPEKRHSATPCPATLVGTVDLHRNVDARMRVPGEDE
jgi:hypothetical protein